MYWDSTAGNVPACVSAVSNPDQDWSAKHLDVRRQPAAGGACKQKHQPNIRTVEQVFRDYRTRSLCIRVTMESSATGSLTFKRVAGMKVKRLHSIHGFTSHSLFLTSNTVSVQWQNAFKSRLPSPHTNTAHSHSHWDWFSDSHWANGNCVPVTHRDPKLGVVGDQDSRVSPFYLRRQSPNFGRLD